MSRRMGWRRVSAATLAGLRTRAKSTAAKPTKTSRPVMGAPPLRLRVLAGAEPIRFLGIDPGSRLLGFALLEQTGGKLRALEYGVLKATGSNYVERLAQLSGELGALIPRLNPDEVAIERAFVHKNPDSALKLGQARGMVMTHCFGLHLPIFEYTPRLVKQSVVGSGAADKTQVQKMVTVLLNLSTRPPVDAADACAVAICHSHGRLLRGVL